MIIDILDFFVNNGDYIFMGIMALLVIMVAVRIAIKSIRKEKIEITPVGIAKDLPESVTGMNRFRDALSGGGYLGDDCHEGSHENRVILLGTGGYDIELDEAMPETGEDPCRIIIAMHGLCGSKASRCITMLQESEVEKGIGLVKFDWPAHGRSNAGERDFTITNCLGDLDRVIRYVKSTWPDAELIAFATSYGGYIAMLYNGRNPGIFSTVILRSPALHFGRLLQELIIDEDMQRQLNEADEYRVEDLYSDGERLEDVFIIHGDADEVVPYEDSVAFAEEHGILLHTVKDADHRYMGEGQLEEAVAFAAEVIEGNPDGQMR